MRPLIEKDYVTVEIDVDRMEGGKDVDKRIRGDKGGGLPWLAILDTEGKTLATSDGPKGNIGCPAQPDEIDWFLEHMIKPTARKLSADDHARLRELLEAWAKPFQRPARN